MIIGLTGHTGFKGVWFAALMQRLNHEVHGFSLPASLEPHPLPGQECRDFFESQSFGTVHDYAALKKFLSNLAPVVAVHFAAQPLVGVSQRRREATFQTNVLGTLNFLRAVEETPSIDVGLVITTDKVYVPSEDRLHVETDPLGGIEPYSQSKAVADFLTQEWSKSSVKKWAIARAGNIIGFGDRTPGRLLPDIAESARSKTTLLVRNPSHVRPWQHVIDCVAAYERVIRYTSREVSPGNFEAFNVGPQAGSNFSVSQVVRKAAEIVEFSHTWANQPANFVETPSLQLSSTKASRILGWEPKLTFEESVSWTLSPLNHQKRLPRIIEEQVKTFLEL